MVDRETLRAEIEGKALAHRFALELLVQLVSKTTGHDARKPLVDALDDLHARLEEDADGGNVQHHAAEEVARLLDGLDGA